MSAHSNHLEEALLNFLFNSGATPQLTQPTATQVSLHTADPGEDGATAEVTGAEWTNYARVTVNNDGATSPFWRAAVVEGDGHRVDNNGLIDFGTATVTGTQADVTHFVVWDGADPLYIGPLDAAKTIQDGDPVRFEDGALNLDDL